MRNIVRVSKRQARELATLKQGLGIRDAAKTSPSWREVLEIIRRIGLVQIDALRTVERSQYLVVFSRLGPFPADALDELLFPRRLLFEQWAHAASLLPVDDLAVFWNRIIARREQAHRKLKRLGAKGRDEIARTLAAVRELGPVSARGITTEESRGTWWKWSPTKLALEILFEEGYIAIERRDRFERLYSPVGRVYPRSLMRRGSSDDSWKEWATKKGLECLGIGRISDIGDYYRLRTPDVRDALAQLVRRGEVVQATVAGTSDVWFLSAADLALIERIRDRSIELKHTTFLSPFDNLIWSRHRCEILFDFRFRLETYRPRETRSEGFGYYVLPLLDRGMLIGRADMRFVRAESRLIVRRLALEVSKVTGRMVDGLRSAVRDLMQFIGARELEIEIVEPAELKGKFGE